MFGLRAALLAAGAFPFHADEAVVGLMARHINGGDWPAFFYGQAYMGSLDATLVALALRVGNAESVLAIRLVQLALYGLTILTAMLLARAIFGEGTAALFCGLLLAVPTVNVTLYTTVSLGGYGEALLIGNLLLLTALRFSREPRTSWLALAWGGLAGLGLWVFGLTLVFSLPTGVWMAITIAHSRHGPQRWRLVAGMALMAALGAAPWLWSAIQQGPQAFVTELLGSAIAGASPAGFLRAAGSHLLLLAVFGPTVVLGLRPPWGTTLLAAPLAPFAVAFWLYAGYQSLRWLHRTGASRPVGWALLGVVGATLLGLVITPFGADPSGRYFLPLAVPMALAGAGALTRLSSGQLAWGWPGSHPAAPDRPAAGRLVWSAPAWLTWRRLAWAVLGLVLAFNLWGTVQAAARRPPGITTQFNPETRVDAARIPELARLLEQLGERRGYTTYWVAYPLAFHTQEQLIYVPRLPYHLDFRHTERDNRYPPYNGMVESAARVAYITFRHPALDERIRAGLEAAGASWKERELGDYRVFHDLSIPVRPEALDLDPDD